MMWYAVYETVTGMLQSIGTVEPVALPDGLAYKTVGAERPTGVWNASTLAFEPQPNEIALEPIDFLRLFTPAERIGVRTAAATDPVVEDFLDMLNRARQVHLSNADTIAGIGYLVQQGLLTQARADQILAGQASA